MMNVAEGELRPNATDITSVFTSVPLDQGDWSTSVGSSVGSTSLSKDDLPELRPPTLEPLEKMYLEYSKPCKSNCLAVAGEPEFVCKRPWWGCCGPVASSHESVVLPHDRVAVVVARCQGNINHDFHENFWLLLWWATLYGDSDFAILVDRENERPGAACFNASHWTDDLFFSVARHLSWKVYRRASGVRYCAAGRLHPIASLRHELRPRQLLPYAKQLIWLSVLHRPPAETADRILIYSRGRSSWRRIRDPERLRELFHQRFAVEIRADVPRLLVEQARLFADASLVLAPNGGWAPNVIFMPTRSCLVELHLYKADSWVARYGLSRAIGELLQVVGDYHDPQKAKVIRPKRIGGDDEILVTGGKDNLFKDVLRKMQRPAQESRSTTSRPLQIWERHLPAAPTPSQASGRKYIPAAELVQMRPIPERNFSGVSHYKQHQAEAQQARHDYFPYRDEFHPRSKRLLYEMAFNKVDRTESEDSRSCFTLPSTTVSHKSKSTGSLASEPARSASSGRLPTADSLRVGGGKPGALAMRRRQAFLRSPSQSHVDREWYLQVHEKEGPAALGTANYNPRFYNGSMDMYSQAIAGMSALLDGEREHEPRQPK
ncbi:unnamed protein product [Effrenium voratum]|nr:unnamed protein product [Effrenium voratum]